MRLCSYVDNTKPEESRVAIVDGDDLRDVTPLLPAAGPTSLSAMHRLLVVQDSIDLTDPSALSIVDRNAIRLMAPVPDPSKIVAAPVNYKDHQSEMSSANAIESLGVFLKAPSSAIGAEGCIRLPYDDRRFDQEGELACVIGRRARDVAESDALDYVFGYLPLLDITMRGGEDRSTRKSFDTFTPMGPTLVTADEISDPTALQLTCSVNGEVRQSATTTDLIWSVAKLISYASSVMTLHPGDVVTSGTPSGVGPLADGDTIELEIDGLDSLRMVVSSQGAITSPTTGEGHGAVQPVPPDPSTSTAAAS